MSVGSDRGWLMLMKALENVDSSSSWKIWPWQCLVEVVEFEFLEDVVEVSPGHRYVVLAAGPLYQVRFNVVLLPDDVVWLVGRISYLDYIAFVRPYHSLTL